MKITCSDLSSGAFCSFSHFQVHPNIIVETVDHFLIRVGSTSRGHPTADGGKWECKVVNALSTGRADRRESRPRTYINRRICHRRTIHLRAPQFHTVWILWVVWLVLLEFFVRIFRFASVPSFSARVQNDDRTGKSYLFYCSGVRVDDCRSDVRLLRYPIT